MDELQGTRIAEEDPVVPIGFSTNISTVYAEATPSIAG